MVKSKKSPTVGPAERGPRSTWVWINSSIAATYWRDPVRLVIRSHAIFWWIKSVLTSSFWNQTIFYSEREPVRPCNFHTVVIGGFVAHTGPFQLKWWLWFLFRPKMVLLVIVTPKYVGFGNYVGDMPHKFINQKPKNSKKPKKTKKPIPWRKPLGTTFLPRLWFFWFLCFFWFSSSFFVFFSAL